MGTKFSIMKKVDIGERVVVGIIVLAIFVLMAFGKCS